MSSKGRLLAQAITESRVISSALTETAETPSFPITQKYTTVDNLPASGTIGDQAFVEETNRLYIWNGNGWYNIALINTNPSFDSGGSPEASYLLELNDSGYISPFTITLLATDPEGIPVTYSALLSDSASNFVTVTQDSSVFTITPLSVDSIQTYDSDGGSFSITFRASDGVNLATALSEFTVNLAIIIENSKYTTLMLKTNGVDGSQNNTFLDASANNFTITRNGNTTQGSFSPYGDRWSNYFDGNGDSLQTASNNAIGTNPFTIECWIYPLSADANESFICHAAAATSANFQLSFIGGLGKISFYYNDTTNFSTINTVNFNQWNHVAVTGDGAGTLRIFLNGVLENTQSYSYNYTSTAGWRVGRNRGGTEYYDGYISDLRVINGTSLYTANFTPPTEPLTAVTNTELLTCQSNRFKDNSPNNFTLTPAGDVKVTKFSPYDQEEAYDPTTDGGSGYFDGSGDWLSFSKISTELDLDGDFTFECWVWEPSSTFSNTWKTIIDHGGLRVWLMENGRLYVSSASNTGTGLWYPECWNHIAVVRNQGVITGYVNGESVDTDANANTLVANSTIYIAANDPNYELYTGYISDLRIIKGTALYTSNFTPPTEPLTPVANTSLLCNFTNAGIYDASTKNVLETVGNAQVDTAVTKFGSGSMYFDGSGDYLISPNKPDLILAGGPWTIECWVYPTADYSGYRTIFTKRVSGDVSTSFQGYLRTSSGVISFYNGTNYESSTTLAASTWSHCAWVYDGTNINIYVNGTSVLSTAVTVTEVNTEFVIGGARGYTEWFGGYLEDLRITKGLARYTTNFTPPTAPLEG